MKVLLTGPSGRMGPHLVGPFREVYDLATFDLKPSPEPQSFVGDLNDIESLRAAMRGIEVVVHLAATSDEAPFMEELLEPNVIGVYNVLEAARLEKVRRVVFASSIQAVGFNGHDQSEPTGVAMLPRPNSMYGVTKVWGETLGRYYHDKHDLEFVAVRLGAFEAYDSPNLPKRGYRSIWLSPRDAVGVLRACIEKPDLGYAIFNATSITPTERLSLQSAREILGWQPQEKPSDFVEQVD